MNTLFKTARFFYPKPTLILKDDIPLHEPVIFVANHERNYGPSVMQLFFPIKYRPWIIYNMLEKGVCSQYVSESFFMERHGMPGWFSRIMGKVLEPVLIRLMNITDPIPVYRGDPRRISQTFRKSLSVLDKGENILIFPENPDAENYSEDVKGFYEGFIYLAKLYARKTGSGLLFCPVSLNPHTNTVTVGKKIRFNPNNDFGIEAERVRLHLMRQVAGLYHQPWLDQTLSTPQYLTN